MVLIQLIELASVSAHLIPQLLNQDQPTTKPLDTLTKLSLLLLHQTLLVLVYQRTFGSRQLTCFTKSIFHSTVILLVRMLKEVFATLLNPVTNTLTHGQMAGPLNFNLAKMKALT